MQKTRRSLLGAVLLLVLVASGFGTALASERPSLYTIPGQFVFPEGIAYQQGTDNFFVSSAANGTIYRGDLDEAELVPFLAAGSDGRTSATGMQVTKAGELLISGARTGKIYVYDAVNGALKASFQAGSVGSSFVNDVALAPSGAAYFTDSFTPVIYRIVPDGKGGWSFSQWLDLRGSVITYQAGFNLNGIAVTSDGKYLITVQSNTGKLFRIGIADQRVIEIDLDGEAVPAGDGLVIKGSRLYVVQNASGQIAEVKLRSAASEGEIRSRTTDPSFATPTTAAIAKGRMLVVNSQFGGPGLPPFTVSSIDVP
jgi:sugar lactone lactonase YvrE